MTPNEIQSLLESIKDARAPIAAFSLGIVGFSHPIIRQQLFPGAGNSVVFTTAMCPIITSDGENTKNSSGHYKLLLDPSIEYLTSNPRNNFTFISLIIKGAILHVGDAFATLGYLDRSPELEFLRHVRNAVAHGNQFNITRPLSLPASFRTYSISESLHGERLLRDRDGEGYLHYGDALALLDFLEQKLDNNV